MDTDQLTLVLEAASAAGSGAVWVAIAYFGSGIIKAAIGVGGFLTVAWWIRGIVADQLRVANAESQLIDVLRPIIRLAGVSEPVRLASEFRDIRNTVARLIAKDAP